MRRALIPVAVLGLLAGCGTTTAQPAKVSTSAISSPPVGRIAALPKADYIGPITTVMYDQDAQARLSPPRAGEKAGVSWVSVYASMCGLPRVNRCAGQPGPRIMLADAASGTAGGKLHGQLMFILSASNQQCPPAFGPIDRTPAPPGHDCTAISYLDGRTGHWIMSHYGPASIAIK